MNSTPLICGSNQFHVISKATAFYSLVSKPHLEYIETLLAGDEKLFFLSNGVLKDIEKTRKSLPLFKWLDFKSGQRQQDTKEINGNKIQEI